MSLIVFGLVSCCMVLVFLKDISAFVCSNILATFRVTGMLPMFFFSFFLFQVGLFTLYL